MIRAIRTVLLAALALPVSGVTQVSFNAERGGRPRAIVDQIEREGAEGGIQSAALIEPLTALGLLYQEEGDHALALAAFDRATQLVRVNQGLSALEQAPLLARMVHSEEARGNVEAAWELEQKLLELATAHQGDLRTVSIFRRVAEKRFELLERYRGGEVPSQIVLGCYYARSPFNDSCRSGSRRAVIEALLVEARVYQAQAVDALLGNGRYASDALQSLVDDVARSDYLYGGSGIGRILGQILAYRPKDAQARRRRAEFLVQIADVNVLRWHRARRFSAHDSVLEQYEEARELLIEHGAGQAMVEEIFSPKVPVVLPAFEPNPLGSEVKAGRTGYIEVAFDVTSRGKSENIEVLGTTANAARAAERDLIRLIERSSFRPRVENGRIADASRVVVRYHPPN